MKTSNVHPAVTALETAMVNLETAQHTLLNDLIRPYKKQLRLIRHSGQNASKSPRQSRRARKASCPLRRKSPHRDVLLLRYRSAYKNLGIANAELYVQLEGVLAAYDAISDSAKDRWLKPIMETTIVEAGALNRFRYPDNDLQDRDPVIQRAYDILVETFLGLSAQLSARRQHDAYTTDLVVAGRKYETFLNWDVELRRVFPVDFVDCVNSKQPSSQKLAVLMPQVWPALQAARLAQARIKGSQNPYSPDCSKINNGTINERQHANRMMDNLHGKGYGCGAKNDQVSEQNTRRRQYEAIRLEAFIANRQLQELLHSIAETLYASAAETHQLVSEIKVDKYTTIDRWETVRICMNNCLAADVLLRSVGRELKTLDEVYRKDYSEGSGREALAAAFEEVAPTYRRRFSKAAAPSETPSESAE